MPTIMWWTDGGGLFQKVFNLKQQSDFAQNLSIV